MEHTDIDLSTCVLLIRTIQAKGLKALVRVSKNEEVIIKRVLDSGADGVIVPMINSLEDAKKAVGYVKYPPVGKRGVGLFRAQNFGYGFEEYKDWLNNEAVIVAQIEHKDGVENINDILSVEGIDATIIGPYDLSASMGYPGEFNREDVVNSIEVVKNACIRHKKPYGFHIVDSDPENTLKKIKEGCKFVAYSIDFFFLGDFARTGMKKIREGK
jgi:2-dehydro-3-deoxyglucarate aldolase